MCYERVCGCYGGSQIFAVQLQFSLSLGAHVTLC